jgi:hypothetical protein
MAETENTRFKDFVERVIGKSGLELAGGKLAIAFQEEATRNDLLIVEVLNTFLPRWEWWKGKKGGHQISPFIEEQGVHIFKIWLSFIFPFVYRRLQVDCKKGGSMVDCQGFIRYTYNPEERQLIKGICEQFKITMPEQDVARILITNAIKTLDPTISKIIENKYRIFIDKIDFLEEQNENLSIQVGFVGRIG